ncbi:hypothetical protein ACLOJK_018880 [Asimina triloba]
MIEIPDRPSAFDSDEEIDRPINIEEAQYGPDDDIAHEASHDELPIGFLPHGSIGQIQVLYKAAESATESKDAMLDASIAPDVKKLPLGCGGNLNPYVDDLRSFHYSGCLELKVSKGETPSG